MKPSPFEPLMLFRSFLTVVSGFLAAPFVYLMMGLALGYLFFPEFLAALELNEAERKKQLAENLQAVIPWSMFAAHVVLSFVALYFLGWLSATLAPFLHFQHGLFIAILVFAWFLQVFMEDPPSKKLMDMILMLTQPTAILLGARQASLSLMQADQELDETNE